MKVEARNHSSKLRSFPDDQSSHELATLTLVFLLLCNPLGKGNLEFSANPARAPAMVFGIHRGNGGGDDVVTPRSAEEVPVATPTRTSICSSLSTPFSQCSARIPSVQASPGVPEEDDLRPAELVEIFLKELKRWRQSTASTAHEVCPKGNFATAICLDRAFAEFQSSTG